MGVAEVACGVVVVGCGITFAMLHFLLGLEFLISAGVVTAMLIYVYRYATQAHRSLHDIPTPDGARHFVGHLDEMVAAGGPQIWIHNMSKKYQKKVFKVIYGGAATVVVTDLDQVKDVFVNELSESFHSRPVFKSPLVSNKNLFSQQGEEWRSSRRALMPSFNTRNLTWFAKAMNMAAKELVTRLDALPKGKTVDIRKYLGAVTLQVISATSFGRYIPQGLKSYDQMSAHLDKVVSTDGGGSKMSFYISRAFPWMFSFLDKFPIPQIQAMVKSGQYIAKTTNDMADKLRKGEAFGDQEKLAKSFIGHLLNAKDKETGKTLNKGEIESQSFLFIFAGYETTASTLSWLIYELAKNPDIQKKVQAEIDEQLNENDVDIEYKELNKFQYLGWCIQETLRLHSIVTELRRNTYKETTIGGHTIPVGTEILIPTWTVHRDPEQYPNPEEFIPERWDQKKDEQRYRHPMAWQPFGEGPRKCIGYRFALQELKIILSNLLKHYSFALNEEKMTKIERPLAIDIPVSGVHVIPVKRK